MLGFDYSFEIKTSYLLPNVAPPGIVLRKSWHPNFHATVEISSPDAQNCAVNFGVYDSVEIKGQKQAGDYCFRWPNHLLAFFSVVLVSFFN
jgi:hypothetical protein